MNQIIKKNGINYGIGLAVLSVLATTITYAFSLYDSWMLGIGIMIVNLVVLIMLLVNTKKQLGGVFSFKEAFTTYFIAICIMILVGTLYNIVLYNFVDPAAKDVLKEQTIKTTVSTMQKFGAPASEVNKVVEKMEQEDSLSVGSLFTGMFIQLCVAAVFGLLLALIFRSRPQYQE